LDVGSLAFLFLFLFYQQVPDLEDNEDESNEQQQQQVISSEVNNR